MKRCHNCGIIIEEDSIFCPNCNFENIETEEENSETTNNLNSDKHNIKKRKTKMKKSTKNIIVASVLVAIAIFIIIGIFTCSFGHIWEEASCTEAKHCIICGETEDKELGHNFKLISCEEGKECQRCGLIDTSELGHKWKEASCYNPKTCTICGQKEGEKIGHIWKEATCTNRKICKVCGAKGGVALGHIEGEIKITKESTLTQSGEENVYCSRCNEVIKTNTIVKKTPQVEGQSFNFTNGELVEYINYRLANGYSLDTTPIDVDGTYAYAFRYNGVYDNATLVLSKNNTEKTSVIMILGDSEYATSYAATVGAYICNLSDPTDIVLKLYSSASTKFNINDVKFMSTRENNTYMILITTTEFQP